MRFNRGDVPPGWGFHPTDQQLLSYYSNLKDLLAHPNPDFDIKVITLSDYDPWDLFDKFKNNSGGKEMYFFTPREYYRKTGLRKRTAGSGNWRCTGDPRYITREDSDAVIGEKRSFVFHNTNHTQFTITEYEKVNLLVEGDYVLCKLRIKTKKRKAKPDRHKARPRKKARKSKFSDANQDYKQMVANSADGVGEPSNCMASYVEKQHLNYEIPICDKADEIFPKIPSVDEILKNVSFSPNFCVSLSDIHVTGNLFDTSLTKKTAVSANDKDGIVSEYLLDDPYEKTGNSTFFLKYHKNEDSYINNSCFENQNVNEMTANSSHENTDTLAPVEGEGYPCKKPPDFDTQNQYKEKDVSTPDNYLSIVDPLVGETRLEDVNSQFQMRETMVANPAYGVDEPSNHLTLDSENQTPIMMTVTSTGESGDSSHQGACDLYENNTSIYDNDTMMFLMDYDLDNQNPQEIGDVSRYSMSVTSGEMTSNLENEIPNDMNAISLHEISSPWSGNQNPVEITAVSTHRTFETSSLTNFDFANGNQNEMIADFSCKESKRSYPVVLDFGNQNPSKEINISASLEGRWSLLQETPLDFGKQNQYKKNDMSETEYFWSSLLGSSVLETDYEEVEICCKETDALNLNHLGEATFPEINSEMLDELTCLDDLLATLCSELAEPIN
ncbi:NAC domain containing protein 94 [Euphorbia peplus]|nr:NAC domain containing protein 94 [Euphorbia peplus]